MVHRWDSTAIEPSKRLRLEFSFRSFPFLFLLLLECEIHGRSVFCTNLYFLAHRRVNGVWKTTQSYLV